MSIPTNVTRTPTGERRRRESISAKALGDRIMPSGLMVVTALAVRLAVMASLHTYRVSPERDHFIFGGEMGRIARAILGGEGFSSPLHGPTGPTAIVGPVYPYLLAGVFKIFGAYTDTSGWIMLSLNSLFSAITCIPVAALGRAAFGPIVGIWAGWAWVFFPYAIYWPVKWVWDTSLSCLLFTVLLLVAFRLRRSTLVQQWGGFGMLWGLAVLTNTTLLSLFPLALAWICHRRERAQWVRLAAAAVIGFALIVTPWVARNYLVFGHFVLRSNFGLELYQGNHPGAAGLRAWQLGPAFNDSEMVRYREMGELAYMAQKQHEAMQFIRGHPGTFIQLCLRRVVYFWTGTSEIVVPGHLLDSLAFYSLMSVLAFVGLALAVRKAIAAAPLFALALLVFPIPYYVTHPEPRFRHLIEPEMLLLAVYTAATVSSRLKRGGWLTGKASPAEISGNAL